VSEEIREGLNNAYRQLRELLTTFRLQITEGGLDLALQSAAREFAERGQFQVELDARPLPFALSASEQIHLLQICREALSNCARHARAQHVWVRLAQLGEDVELQIEDDGQGLSGDFDQRQHHGLNIMRERARHLHGQLGIEPRASGGTRVHLLFRPGFLARSATSTVG
jgi:two-component system nitrate/nitrite sensor histidine kinase NarX